MSTKTFLPMLLTTLLWALSPAQTVTSDSSLAVANRLYSTGSYESAELTARRRIEQGPVADTVRIEAERIIAFSLVAQGKPDLAREHFENILAMNPSFSLDPILTSPKILTVFQEAKIHAIAVRGPGSAEISAKSDGGGSVSFRTLLFPGWEQLHQGRSESGLIFGSAGILALGSAVTFEILRAPARREYLAATLPSEIADKYTRYNRYYRGEVYSFVAFAAIYIASEFDVFLNLDHSLDLRATLASPGDARAVLTLRW